MEVYQAYTDYEGMMNLTEDLISTVAQQVLGTTKVTYGGVDVDLAPGWARMTMIESIKKFSGADFAQTKTDEEAYALAKSLGIEVEEGLSRGEIISLAFEEKVEDNLVQPTVI